jgi:dipeptidyl aminopeptidase/acylaminoacyl peptidase
MRRWISSCAAAALWVCALSSTAQQPPPVAQARIALDPARFDAYAGYYQLGPRIAVRLYREESRFFFSPVGGAQKMELFAETPERFAAGAVPVTISFKPAPGGTVTEAIVNQAGRDIIAPRISEEAATALSQAARAAPAPVARNWATKTPPHQQLTSVDGNTVDYWPSFTRDGTGVVFSRTSDGGKSWSINRVPAAGGALQVLFQRAELPATRANSASNGRLAFNAGNAIWTMDGNGENPHAIPLKEIVAPAYPSWYPDGQHIAFVDGARNILYRAEIATGSVTPITRQSEVLAGMASVSPDGRWVAFAGQRNAGQLYNQTDNQIWLVDDSGTSRPVEAQPAPGRTPSWSPDGKRIAFESSRGSPDGHYAIFVVDRDGGGLVQVTDYALNGNHPAWSPDGHRLVFSWGSEPGKPNGIAVIEIPQ